jgi:hypothetical protein
LIQRGEDGVSISKALNISVEEVAKSLQRLSVLELVSKMEITELGTTLIEEVDVPAERFEIAYTYREVPGIPPVKSESRDFCLRLIDANRKIHKRRYSTQYHPELTEMCGNIEEDGIQIQILRNQLHGVDMNGCNK